MNVFLLTYVLVQFFFAIILPLTTNGLRSVPPLVAKFTRNNRVTIIQQCAHTNEDENSICGSNIQLEENLREISFPFPSGLLITVGVNESFCLLEHNSVSLRPYCKRVLEMREALSTTTCAHIIEKAELYAASNGGWTSDRHSAYPTTDLPLEAIFGKFSSVHGLVNGHILPQMASFFHLNDDYLSIGELFVAKYEFGADKQSGLGQYCMLLTMKFGQNELGF